MNTGALPGLGHSTRVTPCRIASHSRRCYRARLHSRRRLSHTHVLTKDLRCAPLKAATFDVGLTKDIYCSEPWWSRNSAPNMINITSPAQLLHHLRNAGNRLVVIDFYAKWCRSCRALYPKLSQICRANPDVILLKVDWEDNLELCQAMGIKALPFFHLYQAPYGCVESFMISVSRVRRLKDTIAAYSVPFDGEPADLAGIEFAKLSLEPRTNTTAAQLDKLGQIFAMT